MMHSGSAEQRVSGTLHGEARKQTLTFGDHKQ